jgi:UPF0716 protein FxsA
MAWVLVLGFLVVPIVEIYVIIQVGQVIGAWPTVALLVAESLLGAWLVKHEGRRAWAVLREAAQTGRLPGRELADAGLVLVGGTLLLTPGFVTDAVGFFFVLPFTRPLARRLLAFVLARRAARRLGPVMGTTAAWATTRGGQVVDGTVVPPAGEPPPGEPGPDKGPGRVAGG